MRLVKIKLSPQTPFWFLRDIISLSKDVPDSPMVNIDSLEEEDIKTINHSVRQLEIKLFDGEGNKIRKIDEARFISGEYSVSVDDVDNEETEDFSGIDSITVSDEPEEVEEKLIEVEEADLKAAKILLDRNGNTARKMIKVMPKSEDNLVLLHACLQVESNDRGRAGVIKQIEEAIDGYQ